MQQPKLYKYVTEDRTDIIENGLIRYTQPGAFNDPFEMPIFIEGLVGDHHLKDICDEQFSVVYEEKKKLFELIAQAIPDYPLKDELLKIPQEAKNIIKAMMSKITPVMMREVRKLDNMLGVLSLTEDPDNLLMWAHYAGQHTGFVIEFDSCHPTFDQRASGQDNLRQLSKVIYTEVRPVIALSELDYESIILTKSSEWSYEKEWRIVKALEDAAKLIKAEPYDICLHDLPASCLKSLILGVRASEELANKLLNLVQHRNDLQHVRIKRAKLNDRLFKVDITE